MRAYGVRLQSGASANLARRVRAPERQIESSRTAVDARRLCPGLRKHALTIQAWAERRLARSASRLVRGAQVSSSRTCLLPGAISLGHCHRAALELLSRARGRLSAAAAAAAKTAFNNDNNNNNNNNRQQHRLGLATNPPASACSKPSRPSVESSRGESRRGEARRGEARRDVARARDVRGPS